MGPIQKAGNSGLWVIVKVRKAGIGVMIQAASTFLTLGPRGYKRVRKQSLPLRSSYLVGETRGTPGVWSPEERHYLLEPNVEEEELVRKRGEGI